MIANQQATDDDLRLSRAVSGHGVQEVTVTESGEGVVLRVATRLPNHHGDRWTEATLDPADLTALREWINRRLGDEKSQSPS